MEDIIREFLESSINGTLDGFDFDNAFDTASVYIHQKLAEHGLLEFEDFINAEEDVWGTNRGDLDNYAVRTSYICISTDDIYECIMEYRYKRFRNTFKDYGSFKELLSLYERINKPSFLDLDTSEKTILFDECIHAQHETGDIFDDIDIEAIKEEIDRKYDSNVEYPPDSE